MQIMNMGSGIGIHGGICFSMADTVCAAAVASYETVAVTANVNYNFLRSARVGDFLVAEAKTVKCGQTIMVFAVQTTNQKGILLGDEAFTFYRLDKEFDFEKSGI